MEQQLVKIATDALAILIPAIVALLAELLRRRIGTERVRRIQEELAAKHDLAVLAVRFAQQAYRDLGGQERAGKAANWLATQAAARGIPITEHEIQGLIEAALRGIKDEFGEEWAKVPKLEKTDADPASQYPG